MSIVVRAVGLLPRRWIRAVSRAQWRSPLLQRVFRAARQTMRNRDTVIQKGSGKGLQFNAGSSNAGYVLGTTESCLQEALRLVLRPGATFYDVGANVGFLAVIGARLVGPSGLVHAFEPLPENVRWLRHNIALNGFPNVTVHAVALGKADGTADFHIGQDPNWGSLASSADRHEAMAVQVRRLDSLMTEGLPAPQVMKIDIEGGEIDMLLGAAGTLRAARPLLFIDLHGTNAGVADVLEPLDYDLHVFGGGGSSVRDAEWWVQIFALPRERATELAPVVAALSSLTSGDHNAQARTRKPLVAVMPRILIADALARLALRTPSLERALVAGTRNPLLRRHLRLGAVAMGYPRVLGGREWRIAEMDGYRFYVNVAESPLGVEPYFFRNTGAVWLTRSLIRQGDVCVDAGANAGHYTFLCASLVGPSGRLFAFEPNPEFAELLRRSRALNAFSELVHIDQRALYSVSGAVKRFFVSVNPMNSGTSSLVNHGWYLSSDQTVDVETVTFDDFARDAAVDHFRLVKIDVERAEESVIAGASQTLAAHRIDFLIVELYAGSSAQVLIEQAGYTGYLLVPEERLAVPTADVERDRFGDYLFVRPGLALPSSLTQNVPGLTT